MGAQLASRSPDYANAGRSGATGSDTGVDAIGKGTLAAQLGAGESSADGELARVGARAGTRLVDGGKFEWVVSYEGAFECIAAPAHFAKSVGKTVTLADAPGVWMALRDRLDAQVPPAPKAPITTCEMVVPAAQKSNLTNKSKLASKGNQPMLDLAKTKADLGDAGTHYEQSTAAGNKIVSGDLTATTFWCSGFSMWVLAAAGYDMSAPVCGVDGKPYTFTLIAKSEMPTSKAARDSLGPTKLADGERASIETITFRSLFDGWKTHVLAMDHIQRANIQSGWTGIYHDTDNGFETGVIDEDHSTNAVRGAAGAFKIFGIGDEVAAQDQRPGDFGQARHPNKTTHKQDGSGHAWQVWSVKVIGSAMFGQPRSPIPDDKSLATGWHDHVAYTITKDTDPALVGATDQFVAAEKIEANDADAFGGNGSDGGVRITSRLPDGVVFYGRLHTSPWASWKPAMQP